MEKEILCASGYDFEAILRLAGRKMRNDYKNGKVSKSVILAKIARDKKEADAFSLFQEKGIFSREAADAFRANVLSRGSSEDEAVLYRRFRGHEPDPDALLKKLEII